ncbi:ROK family transcriptional regulator [Planotetraspora sp. GP83]|uniref:ROK family transcriptional regulator n=1 Tax=Planotetraspora sp. GP83 TaxID=3156264 RepID=UPI003511B9D2
MHSSHATLSTLRETNAAVALEAIRRDPPLSRAEIARRTGMTKPTVSSALDLLIAAGLVRETEPPGKTHYGAVYFAPAADVACVLGLDIGGRFVRGALADLDGTMRARHDVRIGDSAPETVMAAITRIRDEFAEDVPIELVVAGVPGVVDPQEGILRDSNPPELEGFAIVAELTSALGVSAVAENDINLAALGEQAAGHGRGVNDFAFLSVGTGVGAGLVLGGRPHRGHSGAAGEIDNPPPGSLVAPDSPSADALLGWAADWAAEAGSSLRITPEDIFAAARQGDELARRILAEEARRIAVRVADLARVADVELVVLGGGIGLACAEILPTIEAALGGLLPRPPRIAVSGLGDAPVLVGALARASHLAWRQVATRLIAEATATRTPQHKEAVT